MPKKLTLDAARERIAELRADVHTVTSAAYPSKIVKAQLRAQIADLAARGTPNVCQAIEAGVPLQWPTQHVQGQISAIMADAPMQGYTTHEIPDTLALFAWLHKDALLQKLDTEVEFYADDENALNDEQRASKITALREQMLLAERAEETLIEASEQQGVPILRRNDADPRAVLGLSSALPPPR